MTPHQALFLSHGGGPLPLLDDAGHSEMVRCLQQIAADLPRPDAVIVVSAHWETPAPTLTGAPSPPLIYDYYGFPEAAYAITYPCPGEPALAREVATLLGKQGITAGVDAARGLDHGVFVPLKILFPNADIPCVQLSLLESLDPLEHIAIGRALGELWRQNVLVIGSGFSFHNLNAFFAPGTSATRALHLNFEMWLADACCNPAYAETDRMQRLAHWDTAPGARYCHPREEHLLPLHVCYGTARAPCSKRITLDIMGKPCSLYLW